MLNKVFLIGRLGRDPDVRFKSNAKAVARLSIATTETRQGSNGDRQEYTEWHQVVVWDRHAEACGKHLAKGSLVFVEGTIRMRAWQDKDRGERRVTEIVARTVKFLGNGAQGLQQKGKREAGQEATFYDDNIPYQRKPSKS
ncbi:MAG: single-stranded DNA-binding protein [Candidatus Binatia bacterium]